MNGLKLAFNSGIDWLGGLFSDFSDNWTVGINNMFSGIKDFFQPFIDFITGITQWLIDLVIPQKNYLKDKVTVAVDKTKTAYPWIDLLGDLGKLEFDDSNEFVYTIGFIGDSVIDFSWYGPYRPFINGIMDLGVYALAAISLVKRIRPKFTVG